MEKNSNGSSAASDSSGVCEKLFGAITANPAFQTIRRISSPARARSPLENLNHAAGKKVIDIQSIPQPADQVTTQVPIKFEEPAMLQPATPKEKPAATKVGPEPTQLAQKRVISIEHITQGKEGKKEKHKSNFESSPVKGAAGEQQHINAATKIQQVQANNEGNKEMNDKFSDYINRARIKIRTMSSKKIQEPDHDGGKDVHFTDYIQRAKNKFKSSSSIVGGTGKFASFKRDQ